MVAVAVGSTAIVAERGRGQRSTWHRVLSECDLMSLLWGVAVGLGMWFLGSWSLGALGAEGGAKHEGTTYLKAAAVGMPFWSMVFAGNASQQGAGDTRTPMVTGLLSMS
jgi:Na+-driven multidrug efflux pump